MLQLNLQSKNNADGDAEMFITSEDNVIMLTVITKNNLQFDFSIDEHEWKQLKTFIDLSLIT